jgi:hypothetical protein
MATLPKLGVKAYWEYRASGWKDDMDGNLLMFDCIIQLAAEDKDQTSPPGSPSVGDTYIVGDSATGDWSGHDDKIAVYVNQYDSSGSVTGQTWQIYTPQEGWICWVKDEKAHYYYDPDTSGGPWHLL